MTNPDPLNIGLNNGRRVRAGEALLMCAQHHRCSSMVRVLKCHADSAALGVVHHVRVHAVRCDWLVRLAGGNAT